MEALTSIDVGSVLAHLFFIAAGVGIGVRAADDLMLWREHRAAKQPANRTVV